MCDDSPPTKDNIFGTLSASELEQGEDRDVSGSAVASSKKRAAPDGSHRARLTVAKKMAKRTPKSHSVYLPPNTTSHVHPLDGGIIMKLT